MCAVSMISDHYQRTWPLDSGWTKIRWEEYQELLRKANEYDRRNNQPDCVDPKKAEFTQAVEKLLKEKGLIE